MLDWDNDERLYQHGTDRGVIYLTDKAVVWNGITGVQESGNGTNTTYYIDGVMYMTDSEASDFSGSLNCYFFPIEFGECIGLPEIVDGLIIDNQKPKRFGLSYRTLIGSGTKGDRFGYQIHLIYNVLASLGSTDRKSINNTPSPIEFKFDIVATPVSLPGYRPTARFIIDTRNLDPETVAELEEILYGEDPHLPDPTELYEMLHFGETITATVSEDGYINYKGNKNNVYLITNDEYEIDNINATTPVDGLYDVSDGGNTSVVIL